MWFRKSIPPLMSLVISLLLGLLVITLTSSSPLEAARAFFLGSFSNSYFFGNMLASAVPLILTGLAAAVSFSSSAFNLGLEGQLYFGTLIGTYIAYKLGNFGSWTIVVILGAAFISGGSVAAVSGYLKSKWNVNELISSLLISYSLVYIVNFFLAGPFTDPLAGLAASPYVSEKLMFSKLMLPSSLHSGLLLAIAISVVIYLIFSRHTWGYELRITGRSQFFASYGGIDVRKTWITAMFLSGGLAALGGMIDVLGIHGRMIKGFSYGYGWNGIAVALIARNNPLLVIPSALFFSYLESGAQVGALMSDITPEVARVIQASVFYLVTAEGLAFFLKKRRRAKTA